MTVDSILREKSFAFSRRVVMLYRYLTKECHEVVMSKQILRSGTSIGANISEAIYGSSRRDFLAKLQIARKETAETLYWLDLLVSGDYISGKLHESLRRDCGELMAMLTATINTMERG